jgi:hypothetical protein
VRRGCASVRLRKIQALIVRFNKNSKPKWQKPKNDEKISAFAISFFQNILILNKKDDII